MNSPQFVHDFTEWIKLHTPVEALYVSSIASETVLYALTLEKKKFLQKSMIFTGYDHTSYCKLYNFDENPYLQIEFESGNGAKIECITRDFEINSKMTLLFDRS